ncbi:hypothetical protein DPEC_G00037480 [Dallia pectoralis]|uniref:Uncharacterized protein n=1 Tax=Dallia pectoralis TaxID=75939 RepID=A0ACC2HDX2_DALPE|nr:hypothetical protein DPEC_G00037480 [Dallia pectoralis]
MSYKGRVSCNNRVSKEDQEFYALKHKAADYYKSNGVPQKIECILNDMFYEQPDDVYGYLTSGSAVISSHSEDLNNTSQDPSDETNISTDTRRDSVNAALHWIHESLSTILKGSDPCNQTAVDQILSDFYMARFSEYQDIQNRETEIQPPGTPVPEPPPSAPHSKDKKGGDKGKKGNSTEKPVPRPEPSELVLPGSMAIGSVSLAVAKTGSLVKGVPLYKYIRAMSNQQPCPKETHIPVPLATLLSCGKLSPGKLNLLEEVIVIPKAGQSVKQVITMVLELEKEITKIMNRTSKTGPILTSVSDSGALVVGYECPEQPLDLITEAANTLGLGLGKDIHLALNCAAHDLMDYPKGKYEVISGTPKTPDELVDIYAALISKYPAVVALIDPLRKEDVEQWERLSNVVGASCSLLSEISSKPKVRSSHEDAPSLPGVKGHILNQTNVNTVTDFIRVTTEHKGAVIIGTTCGEPCSDDSLSDMVVGLGVGYVKLGGLRRGERLTKYNRLISIEEELAQQGILDSRQQHTSPLFVGETDAVIDVID